ncbi:MAG: LysR family transcriptional regulator [Paracoccus sp. (in: a-proteobacteria)]
MDRNLRAFLSVARKGNLTAASEEIGLTQPAVTKTIRRLESELGTTLFERTARGMFLNEAGKCFLSRAESIENQYRFAAEEMTAQSRGQKPVLRIVAGVAYLAGISMALAARLHEEFPDTQIDLRADLTEPNMPDLIRGDVDMILGALVGPPPPGIAVHPLLRVDVHVFAGPKNPLFHQPAASLAETAPYPWATFHRDSFTEDRLGRAFADLRLAPPRIGFVAHSIEACLDLVSASVALIAAAHPIGDLARERGLRRLALPGPLWSFQSGIWLRESARGFPVMQRAIALLDKLSTPLRHEFQL